MLIHCQQISCSNFYVPGSSTFIFSPSESFRCFLVRVKWSTSLFHSIENVDDTRTHELQRNTETISVCIKDSQFKSAQYRIGMVKTSLHKNCDFYISSNHNWLKSNELYTDNWMKSTWVKGRGGRKKAAATADCAVRRRIETVTLLVVTGHWRRIY